MQVGGLSCRPRGLESVFRATRQPSLLAGPESALGWAGDRLRAACTGTFAWPRPGCSTGGRPPAI